MRRSYNGLILPETAGELVLYALALLLRHGKIAPTVLSNYSGASVYRSRKAIHEMRDAGLVELRGNEYHFVSGCWLMNYFIGASDG